MGHTVTIVGHAGSVGFLGISLGVYTVTTTCPVRPGSILYTMCICAIFKLRRTIHTLHTLHHMKVKTSVGHAVTSVGHAVTSVGHAGSVGFLGLSLGVYTVTTIYLLGLGLFYILYVYVLYSN